MGLVNVYENGKISMKIKKDGSCLVDHPFFLIFISGLMIFSF